jgi:hypothetical protein
MRKLSPHKIQTLKELHSSGVRISYISKVFKTTDDVSLSTAYYHLSPNREAYANTRTKQQQRNALRVFIYEKINAGYNTQQIADMVNVPLRTINRLYVGNK